MKVIINESVHGPELLLGAEDAADAATLDQLFKNFRSVGFERSSDRCQLSQVRLPLEALSQHERAFFEQDVWACERDLEIVAV